MHKPLLLLLQIILLLVSCTSYAEMSEVVAAGVGSVKVYVDKFSPEKHTIKSCGDYKCLIDGAPFFGSDGKVPTEKIVKIVFSDKDGSTSLDVSGMYDPGINNDNIKDKIRIEPYWGKFYKVTGHFSDGAGTYIAQWLVTSDGSIRTHISDIETVDELYRGLSAK